MTPHEQNIQEIFNRITVQIPGSETLHAITIEGFTLAVDALMDKAYYYGTQQAAAQISEPQSQAHE